MGRPVKPLAAMAMLAGLMLLAGCGGGKVARLYVLTPITVGGMAHDPDAPVIAIAVVKLPTYLDRLEVVTRSSRYRIAVSGDDVWGGRLDDDVTRVLAENLSDLLATDRITWAGSTATGFQVAVDIVRFERDSQGVVILGAFWSVTDAANPKARATRHSTIVRKFDPGAKGADGYDATVDLMSDALAGLSQDIADAIEAFPR